MNGFDLTLDTSSKGTIFYTLDGNDPRLFTSENDTITTLIEDDAEKSVIFVTAHANETRARIWLLISTAKLHGQKANQPKSLKGNHKPNI